MGKKAKKTSKQPYSNMKARSAVLFMGFVLTLIGFLCFAYAILALLVPQANVISSALPYNVICASLILSMSISFVGLIFAVAGANTHKAIARFSFLFGTLSFIASAGFLVVMLLLDFFPFGALGRLLS